MSPHGVARFFISESTHFALSFFTWLKACRSFIPLRALGVMTLTSWLLPLGRQNELKLIIWDDLFKERGEIKRKAVVLAGTPLLYPPGPVAFLKKQ